jgi:site-specific recombinase XerD
VKPWIDRFIEWGLNQAEKPWELSTAKAYERELRKLERAMGKKLEYLKAEDLRTYQARQRAVPAVTWNRSVVVISAFYQYLGAKGVRRDNPSSVLTRRRAVTRPQRPVVDVVDAIAGIQDETDRRIALFLYHSGLKIGEAASVNEPPVNGRLHVLRWGGTWEWVP